MLLMLLLPLGGVAAAATGNGKAKGIANQGQPSPKRLLPSRDGGIDPTTVPIVDEDLEFSVGCGDTDLLLGDVAREQLQVDEAHAHATGSGVVVAVLDGGFNLEHPAIACHVLGGGYDAIEQDFDAHDTGNGIDDDLDGVPDAACGHGTFVAAMVAGAAPDAWILPIKIRDDEGFGTNDETVRGLEYAWQMGADVVNLSISAAAVENAGLVRTIRFMRRSGVAFVASMGNRSYDAQNALAGLLDTLAVGAVDASDQVAAFSNYNLRAWRNAPVVYAPGVELYGSLCVGGQYAYGWWSGTSFATGIVSGAAALALEIEPDVAPLDLYSWLASATDPAWGPLGEDLDGLGRINLLKVVTR